VNPTFADRYRGKAGMLAWMLMRGSGILLAVYALLYVFFLRSARGGAASFDQVVAQFQTPFWLATHVAILGVAVFHLLNGIRLLALEAGYGLRRQRELVWIALALSIGLATLYAVLAYANLPAVVSS
jgi:succinate dehydrogenase / fumarate reductase, cytochrome b subunit